MKNQVADKTSFPFVEALTFSILLWVVWGFAEAFYLQKIAPYFHLADDQLSPRIFLAAFVIYITVAVVAAGIFYSVVKWLLVTQGKNDNSLFRAITLGLILASFFAVIVSYSFHLSAAHAAAARPADYTLLAVSTLFALLVIVLVVRSSLKNGFQMPRSGTVMASVLALSLLFSFVSFPIFAGPAAADQNRLNLAASTKRLMAYHYLGMIFQVNQ